MSGLERLRNLKNTESITIHSGGYAHFDELDVAKLEHIADEIERDLKCKYLGSAWCKLGSFINDILDGRFSHESSDILRRYEGGTFTEWLNRWYLPRPVIDGEPVQFGERLVNNIGQETVATSMFFYSDSDKSSICVNGRYVNEWERIEPDSIEKLRSEMLNLIYASAEEVETIVNDWLSRAEKLFKDGGE